jgi:amino-acid N-acetyltransferase
MEARQDFIDWLRSVAPYVHAHRGKTFVIGVSGEVLFEHSLRMWVDDVALLSALGVRVVLVFGSRPQIEAQLALKHLESIFHGGIRVTDLPALECAKEAAGEIRLDLEAAFSQALPDTPMAHAELQAVSGNFVTARPMGIIDGVDFQHTGVVRKVNTSAITRLLEAGCIVLLPPLAVSPTGESFNVSMEDVAVSTAVALDADKLVFITETQGVIDSDGSVISELSAAEARNYLSANRLDTQVYSYVEAACRACDAGVAKTHILDGSLDGMLLLELFTRRGVGTMVVEQSLSVIRPATLDDVGAIMRLIEPLEADGTLVHRGRERLEGEIEHFYVLDHDHMIDGCVALYLYSDHVAEMACFTVDAKHQGKGEGERILDFIEQRAKQKGVKQIFVLTTRTKHWFQKRGFRIADVGDLPEGRQGLYNHNRKSVILFKKLG